MSPKTTSSDSVLQQLCAFGIVPVVVIDDPRLAGQLGQALKEGGLPCAEITFRTSGARDAIQSMHEEHPDILVGAGTVLTVHQAEEALKAGASFIVAPGLNPAVVAFCTERGIPVTPGIMTPTDIEAAIGLGLNVLKFFPAEAAGGLRFLKAVSAPYKMVRFIPTGGIDRSNFLQYLSFPATLAIGGSWMVKAEVLRDRRFDLVRNEVTDAVRDMIGLHIESGSMEDAEIRSHLDPVLRVLPLAAESTPKEKTTGTVLRLSVRSLERALVRLSAAGIAHSRPDGSLGRVIIEIGPAGWVTEIVQR